MRGGMRIAQPIASERARWATRPWRHARRLLLDPVALRRKREAVRAFTSQLRRDPSTGAPPVLRATTLARAQRPYEVVFL